MFKLGSIMGRPPNDTGWYRRNAELRPMPITERMLLRHGWYRRQLRKQGVAIDPNAKNAVAFVSAVSGLPLEGR